MADRTGQQLGNYRLLRLLGQGGFADTYLGEHLYLKTFAAIKVLQTQLARSDQEAFFNEARTIARLKHPNIVRVLEFGVDASTNTPYLVMEYAPNGTLRQRHRRGLPVPISTIIPYVKQIATALQHAHDQKLVHRDVKPENMLIGANNEVLLSDFGIAIIAQSTRAPDPQSVAGTVSYMAPEQIQGMPRPASDQYALAIVVYEWLTGVVPFSGTYIEVAIQQERVAPPPLREKEKSIPPDVEQVVLTALSKDPQRRFGSVQAFANALESASKEAQPQPAPPRRIEDPELYQKTRVASSYPPTVPAAPGEQIPQTGYGMEPPYPAQPTPPRIPNPYTPQATPPNPYAPQQTPPALPNPYASFPPVPGQQGPYNPQFTPPRQTYPPPPPGPQAPFTAQQTAPQAPFLPLPPGGSPKPRRALSPVITVLLIILAVLLIGGGGGLIYYTAIFQPNQRYAQATATSVARTEGTAHANATSTAFANATSTAFANSTATVVAQPTATATALQAIYTNATSGTPTISDPLTSPSNLAWDNVTGNGFSCAFSGGAYHSSTTPNALTPCAATATNFSDFALQVQMTVLSGHSAGLIFRCDSAERSFYAFRISTNGDYRLTRFSPASGNQLNIQTLAQGTGSPAVHQGLNQPNLIAVVARGDTFYLYVNGQYVDSGHDSTYKSGEIGVYSDGDASSAEAAFSTLQVWKL